MNTHNEIFDAIKKLNNSERIKLLNKLFDEYFDSRPPKEVIEREEAREIWGDE